MEQKYISINGSYIEADVPLITDSTGQFAFSPESLAVTYSYDGSGNLQYETRGPDAVGNSYRKQYTFTNGVLSAETAWVKQ